MKYRFNNKIAPKIGLLLKNYKLSDDIAFRFGNRGWPVTHSQLINLLIG
jgi:alpha-amylase